MINRNFARHFPVLQLFPLLLLVSLVACTPASTPSLVMPSSVPSATRAFTPSPTVTPSPSATATATPTMTPSPTPTFGPQTAQFTNAYIQSDAVADCFLDLPSSGLVVGSNPQTCTPSDQPGQAIFTLPPSDREHFATLRVVCPDPQDCLTGVTVEKSGGISLTLEDGTLLWSVRCSETEGCDRFALREGPHIVIHHISETPFEVYLTTSPGIQWVIADLVWETYPLPQIIQGIAYSPFRDCQSPNRRVYPTEAQIREDMALLKHMGNAIRTYALQDIQSEIPVWAIDAGLRVSAGAWIDKDRDINEVEIKALVDLAQRVELESVIVGNEVLLRATEHASETEPPPVTEDELLEYIARVRSQVNVPVTTAETWHILKQHPRIVEAVDYVMVHIYPYWEGVPVEAAAQRAIERYREVQQLSPGKKVVIGETGWPAAGPIVGAAVPNLENQRRYMREFLALAQQEDIEFYYFAAFNELWKTEGGAGPYWGFMDPDRRNKFDIQSVLLPVSLDKVTSLAETTLVPFPTGTAVAVSSEVRYVYHNYEAVENEFVPSGYMGDWENVTGSPLNDCYQWGTVWEDRAIQIRYEPGELGWAGVYWQYPENNWATLPEGRDLRGYSQLRFSARSDQPGSQFQFWIGGVIDGPYPSSIRSPRYAREADGRGFVKLSAEWQEYHIDLTGLDLSHVIDGFAWAADKRRTPEGGTLYLDNIYFDKIPLPTVTPRPTSTPTPIPVFTPIPPDVCPGNDSASLTSQAWQALNARDYDRVLACTAKVTNLWTTEALAQQAARINAGACLSTPDPQNKQALDAYWAANWALNDVATSWHIRRLALDRLGRNAEALEARQIILSHYTCAFAWDPRGWFWNVAAAQ